MTAVDLTYISVDVETAGPSPAEYPLLAIGACGVADPTQTFYVELQPDREGVDEGALRVSELSLERLQHHGAPASVAMHRFTEWVDATARGSRPVFVALNAPFDWMFVADYFHRYTGRNPFGHSALDLKALFMGITGVEWSHTALADITAHLGLDATLPHHALEDAVIQAAVFRRLLEEAGR